jgi:hypothetical protein
MKWILLLVLRTSTIEIIDEPFDTETACRNVGFAMKARESARIASYHCKAFPMELFIERDWGNES